MGKLLKKECWSSSRWREEKSENSQSFSSPPWAFRRDERPAYWGWCFAHREEKSLLLGSPPTVKWRKKLTSPLHDVWPRCGAVFIIAEVFFAFLEHYLIANSNENCQHSSDESRRLSKFGNYLLTISTFAAVPPLNWKPSKVTKSFFRSRFCFLTQAAATGTDSWAVFTAYRHSFTAFSSLLNHKTNLFSIAFIFLPLHFTFFSFLFFFARKHLNFVYPINFNNFYSLIVMFTLRLSVK